MWTKTEIFLLIILILLAVFVIIVGIIYALRNNQNNNPHNNKKKLLGKCNHELFDNGCFMLTDSIYKQITNLFDETIALTNPFIQTTGKKYCSMTKVQKPNVKLTHCNSIDANENKYTLHGEYNKECKVEKYYFSVNDNTKEYWYKLIEC